MAQKSAEIRHPDLGRLHDYWNSRRGGRDFPRRADLDPADLLFLLGDILLMDVLQEPLRFRFRLFGTYLAERAGYDLTGKYADDLPEPENRRTLLDCCRAAVETRRPFPGRHSCVLQGLRYEYETLWLPFSEDGERISMLLGGHRYDETPLRVRRHLQVAS